VKRLLRKLFYAAACVSALLLLATLILWPVSYYRYQQTKFVSADETLYALDWVGGRIVLEYGTGLSGYSRGFDVATSTISQSDWDPWSYLTWNKTDSIGTWSDPIGYPGITCVGAT